MSQSIPLGERHDVVTYRIVDRTGAVRGMGLKTQEQAFAIADGLADNPAAAPLTIERTNYVAFTHRETVAVVEAPGANSE